MTSPEARDQFDDRLKLLEEQFTLREERRKVSREEAEVKGEAKAQELLPDGALGRISEESDPRLNELTDLRQQLAQDAGSLSTQDRQQAQQEVDNIDQQFNTLIDDQRLGSAANIAKLDAGKLQIQQALSSQLRNAKGQANLGNVGPSGLPAGLINDASGSAVLARGNLSRDLIIDSQRSIEDLQIARSANKLTALSGLRDSTAQGLALRSGAIGAAEGSINSQRSDILSRQLQNLNTQDRETFGRLSIINNSISQDIADSSGTRQNVLSEINLAESQVNAQESLEIQRLGAEKEAPSSGLSIVCTVLYNHGELDTSTYIGDMKYAELYISEDTRAGYYTWGVPLANLANRNATVRKLIRPIVVAGASQMAYKMGMHKTGSYLGMVVLALAPVCTLIGKCTRWLGLNKQILESGRKVA